MTKNWRANIGVVIIALVISGCGSSKPPVESENPETPPEVTPANPAEPINPDPNPDPSPPVDPSPPPVEESEEVKQAKLHAAMLVSADGDRGAASDYFDSLGEAAIEQVLDIVDDKDLDTRKGAVFFLMGKFEPDNGEIVSTFAAKLKDDDRSIRHLALQMVRFFPVETLPDTLPRLAEMLDPQKEDESNRLAVARLLKSLSTDKELVLPALLSAAKSDPAEKVRSAAVDAVFEIAPVDQKISTLDNALANETTLSIRRSAARRLELSGQAAAPAAKSLAAVLGDADKDIRTSATNALLNIGSSAIEHVVPQLKSGNQTAKLRALLVLGKMKEAAIASLGAIRDASRDPDPEVQELAKTVAKYLENLQPQ